MSSLVDVKENKTPNSEFNSAIPTLIRLDDIKRGCQEAKLEADYKKWLICLYMYLSEVNPQMSKEEEEAYLIRLKELGDNLRTVHNRSDTVFLYGDAFFHECLSIELDMERFFDKMGNKFKYAEKQLEVTFDIEELAKLRRENGVDWQSKDPSTLVKGGVDE